MVSGNTYQEVYEILSYMDKLTVMKIPEDILTTIKIKRNPNFITKINKQDIFNEENVSKETIDLLCWLDYNYWMNDEQRIEIDKLKREISIEVENEKREKYNPNTIFKKNTQENNVEKDIVKDELSIIEYKESIFRKIINKIKSIFIR